MMKKLLAFCLLCLSPAAAEDVCYPYGSVCFGVNWETATSKDVGGIKDVNQRDQVDGTPLHWAAWLSTAPEVISALISAGADANVRESLFGRAPLHDAARYNPHLDIILALLGDGADVNARDNDKETPLHWAAGFNNNVKIISALIDAGADVNAQNRYGSTPLHLAAWNGSNPKVLAALIKAGANVKIKNMDGKLPYDLIRQNEKLKKFPAYWKLLDAHFQ